MERRFENVAMMTSTEVADFLSVHPNTVRRWANMGLLPVYRLGSRGDRRFKREDVEGFMKGNGFHSPELVHSGKS